MIGGIKMNTKRFTHESILWLKRLMIITGIYYYAAHLITAVVISKLPLFELNGARYMIINEQIMEDEIKARASYAKTARSK